MSHVCGGRKAMFLQHNARLHTSAATSVAVQRIRFEVVPHPSYGLDLALSDFWLFASSKKHFKGIYFTCDEKVQAAVGKGF
jgi:hypothetical protein